MIYDSQQRKERYAQLIEDSAVVWHKLYEEEKLKREELQQRYDALTKQIRKQGKDKVDDEYYKNLKDFIDNDSTEEWDDDKEGM